MAKLTERDKLLLRRAFLVKQTQRLTLPPKVLVAPGVTFVDWVDELGRNGLLVDGIPFRLDNRPAMRWIYEQIPSDRESAFGRTIILQKCAQVGFTVLEMLAAIFWALKWTPCKIGMYVPDMKLASAKSAERFMPIVRTVPLAYNSLLDGKSSEGNVMIRNMLASRFYFLWTSGKAMTESFPMDVLTFDEVQEMPLEAMEKTRERLSASSVRFTLMGSTANWPEEDINWWYKQGSQHRFHTRCPCCDKSVVLDDYFPECIAYNASQIPGAPLDEYVYVCRHCGGWIQDSQIGEWLPDVATARHLSIHFPQFLSPTISAREIIESYHNAKDMKNFFNRKLGKPYVDPSQVPISLEILEECAKEGRRAGVEWKSRAKQSFMGIDNMGGFSCAYILERMPDGRAATIHVEAIYGINPWARMDELMEEYGVAVCVCEQLPNYDSAKQFAHRWMGRVFLVSSYGTIEDDMLRWGDANQSKADRKSSDEARDRHTLSLDQYKMMSWSLGRLSKKTTLFAAPDGLVQELDDKGRMVKKPILRDMVWNHFTKTALVTEKLEDEHKMKRKVVKVGIDPHFSFAYMLACAAWCRAFGTTTFMLPTEQEARVSSGKAIPVHIVEIMESTRLPPGEVCGRCVSFNGETGRCDAREAIVKPADPGCFEFISVAG